MPTYFFDLIKGSDLVEDDQGEDFVDIEAAKLEGLASARELLARIIRLEQADVA